MRAPVPIRRGLGLFLLPWPRAGAARPGTSLEPIPELDLAAALDFDSGSRVDARVAGR